MMGYHSHSIDVEGSGYEVMGYPSHSIDVEGSG